MAKDYEVGRNKPPKHSQFKKGESGNSAGRPKDVKNVKTMLKEEVYRPIRVPGERGVIETVPAFQVLLRTLMVEGLKKNVTAIRVIMDTAFKAGLLADDAAQVKTEGLTSLARATMQSLLTQLRAEEE